MKCLGLSLDISLHPVKMWTLSETSVVMLFQVPDSAGTATALFTGVKTRMAVLGIDGTPNYNSCDPEILEKSKLKSLLHRAVEDGKATGLLEAFSISFHYQVPIAEIRDRRDC